MNYRHDFTYIRRYYGVPARRGMELIYQPRGEEPQTVRITSASGSRLRIRFPGAKRSVPAHPVSALTYPPMPNPVNRGWCDGCGEDRGLLADGTVRPHRSEGGPCSGVGLPPSHRVTWRRCGSDPAPERTSTAQPSRS